MMSIIRHGCEQFKLSKQPDTLEQVSMYHHSTTSKYLADVLDNQNDLQLVLCCYHTVSILS